MPIKTDKVVDASGLACPMPIVRTKKAMEEMEAGQVLELLATDRGSLADIQAWAKSSRHQYLGTREADGTLHHYVRKADPSEGGNTERFPHIMTNEELAGKLASDPALAIVDVREPAEYAFQRIPGAVSMPLGELERRLGELNRSDTVHLICRSGSRSDMAARLLERHGFANIRNVVPGMSEWNGPVEGDGNL